VGQAALSAMEKLCHTLGLLRASPEEYRSRTRERRIRLRNLSVAAIDEQVDLRNQARKDKDFARADSIRNELALLGISLRDSASGTEWAIEQ
jgi:cysteinyl-tRNA synthetase